MTPEEFKIPFRRRAPPHELSAPLVALWWDAKGESARGHDLINDLETKDAMAVHAYLHRKEGEQRNADYWYRRAGRTFHRPDA
jgi:hypothetical protein